MQKIMGYCEMKKTEGKVVFVAINENNNGIVGNSCDKLFIYGEVSKKITKDSIGKIIELSYGRGYSGRAYVSDVNIK